MLSQCFLLVFSVVFRPSLAIGRDSEDVSVRKSASATRPRKTTTENPLAMNPPNPFGSPQSGAFQVQGNNAKSSLFQSFGQQSVCTTSQPQPLGMFQRSAFGQPAPLGNVTFGQTPSSFGQPSAQPSPAAAFPQAPEFGQSSTSFGSGMAPAFGQPNGSNPSSAFGQVPAFGQASGFSKQPVNFGLQSSGFGDAQMTSGPNAGAGQTQSLGFGKPLLGQPSATSVATNVFQSGAQSRGFDASGFTFKPSNEALFKPIFSASPEPANPQNTAVSGSPFGGASQTSAGTGSPGTNTSSGSGSSTATAGFSLLTGAASGPVGFSFSQPAATPAVSAKSNPLTTGSSVQFTFSQPAAPSGSSPQAPTSTSQPTTPSSFSFSVKPSQGPQAGAGLFSQQPSAFGDSKFSAVKADAEVEGGSSLAETNVFARLSKGTKRKEEPLTGSPVNPDLEESPAAETDALRHQPKRALLRSRGPAVGLFGRALSDLRKDTTSTTTSSTSTAMMEPPPKYMPTKETETQALLWEETGEVQVQVQSTSKPVLVDAAPTPSRDLLVTSECAAETGETCGSDCVVVMHQPLCSILMMCSFGRPPLNHP